MLSEFQITSFIPLATANFFKNLFQTGRAHLDSTGHVENVKSETKIMETKPKRNALGIRSE